MNEVFGVKGSVRKLEQRKHRKQDEHDPLGHIRDFDSFDVEFFPSGQVLQETWYTRSGSIYERRTFEYDNSSRLIRALTFSAEGKYSGCSELAYSESKCSWSNRDAEGTLTSRGVDDYMGKHLRSTSAFDSQNRLTKMKSFEYVEGRLTKSDSHYYLPDGPEYERCLTDYDTAGRIRRTFGLKADGSPLGDGKYLYEYDEEGRRSKVWTFNEFSGDDIATSVRIFQYVNDEVGNWIERREKYLERDSSYRSETLTTRTLTYKAHSGE